MSQQTFNISQVNSCDQNMNSCCELIELTAKIQGQLFAILNLTAAEGKLHISTSFPSCLSAPFKYADMHIRRSLCWSRHAEDSTAPLAWNLFLPVKALSAR